MSHGFSKGCRRRALTLIEVTASLTLMSILLVSSLMAFGRHQRQLGLAEQQEYAIAAAEGLMHDWYSVNQRLPVSGQGQCGPQNQLVWATRPIGSEFIAGKVPADVIRLSIYSSSQAQKPLFSMELVQAQERDRP
jgi:type II secretory pathway pseudopilin PulG